MTLSITANPFILIFRSMGIISIELPHILVSKKDPPVGLLVLFLATVSTVSSDLPDAGVVITVNDPFRPMHSERFFFMST
jgi:hypothetical protein